MPTFNATNPVSVGLATKKDHYDRVFDNTVSLYDSLRGVHDLYVPVAAMRPLTSGGCGWHEDVTSTNNVAGMPFDPSSSEGAYFWVRMPPSWDEGTVTARFVTVNKAGGSGNYVFSLAGLGVSDGEAMSTAIGTAQQVTDAAATAYYIAIGDATAAITLAGSPAAGDYCLFVVKRLPADAADTYGSDVYLSGVVVTLTTDAPTDA